MEQQKSFKNAERTMCWSQRWEQINAEAAKVRSFPNSRSQAPATAKKTEKETLQVVIKNKPFQVALHVVLRVPCEGVMAVYR